MNFIGRIHESIIIYTKGDAKYNTEFRVAVRDHAEMYQREETLNRYISLLKKFMNLDYLKSLVAMNNSNERWIAATKRNASLVISSTVNSLNTDCQYLDQLMYGYKPTNFLNLQSENRTTFGKNGKNYKHPTVKPVALFRYLIQLLTVKNMVVLDPFMGSGTTAVACLEVDRNCMGCEIDKEYCDIMQSRVDEIITNPSLI